ncbi:MAG: WYL domain-containing protein [Acidothermus sp.]|nr:WYL domain-containing protein [Acidothermus sp.]
MSARKTERLLNLVICLLATRRYLTADYIRRNVAGYQDLGDEAFKRKFERDKEELRELGIPLEVGTNSVFDEEPGYRIPRDAQLPEISFTPAELSVLALAARTWQHAVLGAPAAEARLKLQAAGIPLDEATPTGVEARLRIREPAFEPLFDATCAGRAVRFDYREAGASREVEPWGLVSWHGAWYLAGYDRMRRDVRVFRLSRIVGPVEPIGPEGAVRVPEGTDVRALVRAAVEATESPEIEARLLVRRGTGIGLRRGAWRVEPYDERWELVSLRVRGEPRLVDEILSYGSDVVVLDPPSVRAAVLAKLRFAAGVGG